MSFVGQLRNTGQHPIVVYDPMLSDTKVHIASDFDAQVYWTHCTVIEQGAQRYVYELQDFPEETFQPESRFGSRTWVNGTFENGQLRLIDKNGVEYEIARRLRCSDYP